MTDHVGQVIAHYRLDALIGDGGMGTVYKAHDLNLERDVAVKVMHAHYARRAEFRARLTQEAKTAAQLDHPSIVGIYDFGQYNGGLYIAMEYIGGGSLRAHLHRLQSRNQFLPLKQSFQIGVQIADALDYAHRQGVVHRDVKPGNIILKRINRPDETAQHPFRAVLTDFGLVKLLEGDSMTQSGITLGTPTYMSPEQCEGLVMDGRSDLYSLGVVLYELLTNRLPFAFKSLSEAVSTHMRGQLPARPSELRPSLPPVVDSLLVRCLAKSPEARFATGREMADALEAAIYALEGAPTQSMERTQDSVQQANLPLLTSGNYWLQIATPGRKSSHATLTKESVTIGRNADNDIVLPTEGVSRYHARLDATETGWTVFDMGGINGTWLNEERLRPGISLSFMPGDALEIGPYQIILETLPGEVAVAALASTVGRGQYDELSGSAPPADISEAKTAEIGSQTLSVYLARESFIVEPGRDTELKVDVVNRGAVSDRVSLRVLGLPGEWLDLPDTFIRVGSGQSVTIPIQIRPPRITDTPAGRQRFRIEVKSQQHPEVELAVGATLTLGSYEAFEIAMEPKQVSLPALVRVTIRNTGNSDAEFSVIGNDPAEQIQFRGERGRIRLTPRQTAAVDLELDAKQRAWFGKSEVYPFRVEVAAASGARQSSRGRATISSLLPVAILYVVLFFSISLCVVAALLFVFQRDRLSTIPPATDSEIEGIAATSTAAISGSATAAVIATSGAATAAAATAQIIGDRDGDGLSDTQEGIIGTDPDNPDTDSDGLLDGEEVLTWGTEPLIRDTDTDILSDGDEVHTYGTNPTNPDTDGDGIPDGVEVATGTDPLNPLDPPATSTPTILAPTATGTAIIPTATTTASATPTTVPTSTPTDAPTVTPTNTPTIVPSDTPTIIPTETSTATSTPSVTPTSTMTPTLTATGVPSPSPDCNNEAPELDGVVSIEEWGTEPTFTYAPDNDSTRRVKGYFQWVGDQLFIAFEVADPTLNQTIDSLRVYFDVNQNAGDPDSADRFFQIVRDNTLTARAGIETNADGLDWVSEYESEYWNAVVADNGVDAWSIEMHIDAPNEMPDMLSGNPFGMMNLVQYTGSLGVWPEGAISNDAATWQVVNNISCQ